MVPAALFPALALIAGTAGGIEFDTNWRLLLWLSPLMTTAASAAWWLRRPQATLAVTVTAFACCGFILGSDARERALDTPLRAVVDEDAREPARARFRLAEDAAYDGNLTTLRAEVVSIRVQDAWTPAGGGVVLSVGGIATASRVAEWRRGRLLEAPVTFRRPARYLNDGVPDFERDAALDGISLLGSIKSALLVDVTRRGPIVSELAGDVRSYVRRAVGRRMGPHRELSAAIVSAVLIGDRRGLPDEVRARLQAAGTYHVIAISGGNIAILTALLLASLIPIGLSGRRAACATLILLLAYAEVVTAGPSVWRATLVAIVYLLARLLDHRTPPWQAMAVAGGVLAVFQPLDVRNAGFVLTFGATAALLHVVRYKPPGPPRVAWLTRSVAASAAVELVLLPVMAETFSRITVAGLVLNLIAVPAMAVVQIAGLILVCGNAVGSIASVAAWLAHLGASAIVQSARLVDVVPWLSFRVPAPSTFAIAVYYSGLALLVLMRGSWLRLTGLICLLVAAVLITTGVQFAPDVPALRLTMVDVGQGDAMALQVPGRRAVMIDSGGSPFGGGSFDIGARVVEPALWARRMTSLDTLLLTHGDPDHIGGATALIEDFNPRAVWQGIAVSRAMPLQAVLAAAGASGIAVEERREGEELHIGAARLLVLHPPAPDWERQRVRNDDSVVLEVLYGDVALLLTGDIGSEIERQIIPRLIPAKTRVLKVAHHGSRTSTSQALLDAWHPQVALISCGRGNPFGHPAPDVIARLEGIGARIYRTDRHGEITVDTNGEHVVVRTFTGGEQ
jgi:competence protein ComEC